jgi:LDH2 family malate/lactate/ureidoglycolate dehydrogenase
MGIVAGVRAIDLAMNKAEESGSAFATVKHSNHFGTAAFFTKRAASRGFIAIAASNAPPTMAPWGASEPYIGTNPLSIAIPTGDGEDIILDMATSVVAQGKIIMASKNNEAIPEGWAITKDGQPTTDPHEALKGTVLPFGGPKGYGIALIIEILSGILSGADFGPYLHNMWTDFETPQNVGHVFHVIDISKFINPEIFYSSIATLKKDIKKLKKAESVSEVFLPGEIEHLKSEKAKEEGVDLSESTINDLMELSDKWGVAHDLF